MIGGCVLAMTGQTSGAFGKRFCRLGSECEVRPTGREARAVLQRDGKAGFRLLHHDGSIRKLPRFGEGLIRVGIHVNILPERYPLAIISRSAEAVMITAHLRKQ